MVSRPEESVLQRLSTVRVHKCSVTILDCHPFKDRTFGYSNVLYTNLAIRAKSGR